MKSLNSAQLSLNESTSRAGWLHLAGPGALASHATMRAGHCLLLLSLLPLGVASWSCLCTQCQTAEHQTCFEPHRSMHAAQRSFRAASRLSVLLAPPSLQQFYSYLIYVAHPCHLPMGELGLHY